MAVRRNSKLTEEQILYGQIETAFEMAKMDSALKVEVWKFINDLITLKIVETNKNRDEWDKIMGPMDIYANKETITNAVDQIIMEMDEESAIDSTPHNRALERALDIIRENTGVKPDLGHAIRNKANIVNWQKAVDQIVKLTGAADYGSSIALEIIEEFTGMKPTGWENV